MNNNAIIQWILYFFFYCFIGWIWETCYVSISNRKFCNRGFMTGPFLPIYGFGAITILLVTIPVEKNLVLLFIVGMCAATILEYVTGVLMESIFKVRYWDYSNQKLNLNGHICLSSSIAWGGASILITKGIHVPIARIISSIPEGVQEILAVALSIIVSVDFTYSVRDALDIKEILMNMKENNEELQRLQKRLDVLIAVIDDEKQNWKIKIEQLVDIDLKTLGGQFSDIKTELEAMKKKVMVFAIRKDLRSRKMKRHVNKLLHRNPNAVSKEFKKELEEVKRMREN